MGNFVVQEVAEIMPEAPKIAVAVGKGDSSVQALKWALQKMIPAGGTLYLLHVQAPLRSIETPMGPLLIDQVSEEIAKHAKQRFFAKSEKLLQKYKAMCEKYEVEQIVHCIESDSIEKAVVDQISNLGISKLVLGSSSQGRIKRIFKGRGTSGLIAQLAPEFCAVMVVCKGRLCSVRDGAHSVSSNSSDTSSFSSSEFGASLYSMNEGETFSQSGSCVSSIDGSLQDWTSSTSMEIREVACNSDVRGSVVDKRESSRTDLKSTEPARTRVRSMGQLQLSPQELSENVTLSSRSLQHNVVSSISAAPNSGNAAIHKPVGESKGTRYNSSRGSNKASGIHLARMNLPKTDTSSSVLNIFPVHDNGKCYEDSNIQSDSGEANSVADVNAIQMDRKHGHRQRSCDLKTKELKLEDRASNQAKPYDTESYPESCMIKDALRELEAIRFPTAARMQKREELCTNLAEARLALKDKDIAVHAATDEVREHKKLITALASAKAEATASRLEADLARQHAIAERNRYEQALASLGKELAKENQLRKDAEENARREAFAKQEVIASLQKAQRKYKEYSFEALQEATSNFSEDQNLGEGGYGKVYRGTIHHTTVAVKVLRQDGISGQQQFQREVEILSDIRHPHMVMLLGACHERACIVYEYMANGSLEDRLMCKDGTPPLPWHTRFRICSEVATALMFLHSSSPEPIIHRDLKPGNILLDHNFVSKISDVGIAKLIPKDMTFSVTVYKETTPVGTVAYIDPEYLRTGSFGPHSDVYALGIVILQVLTGKRAFGLLNIVETAIGDSKLDEVLDRTAGDWPFSEAVQLAKLGVKCAETRRRDRPDLEKEVLPVLQKICKVSEAAATTEAFQRSFLSCNDTLFPSFFICPLSQEVMVDPHIAADGFTYEYGAIKDWLSKHDTSPMTNLRLMHKNLIKNLSLRSTILASLAHNSGLVGQNI